MEDLSKRLSTYEPFWENWYIDSYIGKGSSSTVYKIKRNKFGEIEYSALKVISINIDEEIGATYELRLKSLIEKKTRAENEIKNMYKLNNCSNVVHCRDYAIKDILNEDEEQVGFDILIRMNYYSCFSKKLIHQTELMSEDEVFKIATQIGTGLKDIHDFNMIHRDIKPENFFIDENGNYLLGDFGVSKQLSNKTSCLSVAGTQPYIAPEIYRMEAYRKTADIYSYGIVLYTLLNNNYLPFTNESSNINQIQTAISRRLSGEQFKLPLNGSEQLKNIIMKCCAYRPEDRYQSMDEILSALNDMHDVSKAKVIPIVNEQNEDLYKTQYAADENSAEQDLYKTEYADDQSNTNSEQDNFSDYKYSQDDDSEFLINEPPEKYDDTAYNLICTAILIFYIIVGIIIFIYS